MDEFVSQSRDEAQRRSWDCPYCQGHGLLTLFDRDYDGRSVIDRRCFVRGEVKEVPYPMRVAGHCLCPIGRWMRGRLDSETLRRIPDLADVLSGRSRWTHEDPTEDPNMPMYRRLDASRVVVRVRDGEEI